MMILPAMVCKVDLGVVRWGGVEYVIVQRHVADYSGV